MNEALRDREYGPALDHIGIIPMCIRPEWQRDRPERRLFQRKQRAADYRTIVDFEKFLNGTNEVRRKLLVKNIVLVVEDLHRKARGKFAGDRLVADILAICELIRTDIDAI
ncbi:MAG TPA: Imm44 family immunity protein [Gemmatimonadaceae bacterium]